MQTHRHTPILTLTLVSFFCHITTLGVLGFDSAWDECGVRTHPNTKPNITIYELHILYVVFVGFSLFFICRVCLLRFVYHFFFVLSFFLSFMRQLERVCVLYAFFSVWNISFHDTFNLWWDAFNAYGHIVHIILTQN